MNELKYSDAPDDWAICYQNDCPLADQCLRRAVARLAPSELTHHATVLPAAREGDHCCLFATAEPVTIARGMRRMLPRAAHGELQEAHKGLYAIFGSAPHYYRYRSGHYPITPSQQQRVASLFSRLGFKEPPRFDTLSEEFFFPKP